MNNPNMLVAFSNGVPPICLVHNWGQDLGQAVQAIHMGCVSDYLSWVKHLPPFHLGHIPNLLLEISLASILMIDNLNVAPIETT